MSELLSQKWSLHLDHSAENRGRYLDGLQRSAWYGTGHTDPNTEWALNLDPELPLRAMTPKSSELQ